MNAFSPIRGGLFKAAVLFLMLLALLPLALQAGSSIETASDNFAGQAGFGDETAAGYKVGGGTGLWDVPLTKHADMTHPSQIWNTKTIRAYIDSGICWPQEYLCPGEDVRIVWRELDQNPALVVGLVIGATIEQIVTSFVAAVETWQNRCR